MPVACIPKNSLIEIELPDDDTLILDPAHLVNGRQLSVGDEARFTPESRLAVPFDRYFEGGWDAASRAALKVKKVFAEREPSFLFVIETPHGLSTWNSQYFRERDFAQVGDQVEFQAHHIELLSQGQINRLTVSEDRQEIYDTSYRVCQIIQIGREIERPPVEVEKVYPLERHIRGVGYVVYRPACENAERFNPLSIVLAKKNNLILEREEQAKKSVYPLEKHWTRFGCVVYRPPSPAKEADHLAAVLERRENLLHELTSG